MPAALRPFAVVLLAFAVVLTPRAGAAVSVGAHPQAGAAFDDPSCHVLPPAPADPFAASGSIGSKSVHWHTGICQCDDVPTRAHVLYLSNVCFNDLTAGPDFGVMVLRSPLPLAVAGARGMNHTTSLSSAAHDSVSPLRFLNGSRSKGMLGFQVVPSLVVGEEFPAKDTEVPLVWHPGLTLIIRPPKDHNISHFWEGISVLWHVLLHPHLYPWLLRVQLVFTPNFGSDEYAYSRDLFDVVLHKLREVRSQAAPSSNSTAFRGSVGTVHTANSTDADKLPQADTPTTAGTASAESSPRASTGNFSTPPPAPASSNRRRMKAQYPPPASASTGIPLLGRDAMDRHHPVTHCFAQAAFPGNVEPQDRGRVFVGPVDAARVREFMFQHLSTPLLPLHTRESARRTAPVRVAFIDRCPAVHSRCIVNHGAVLASLQRAMTAARWRTHHRLQVDFEQWLAQLTARFPAEAAAMNGSALSFDRLSLAAQVAVARNADVLVGVAGAGLVNSVMMEQGSVLLVVSLMDELRGTPAFRLHAASSGNRYMSTPTFSFTGCKEDSPITQAYLNSSRNPNLNASAFATASGSRGSEHNQALTNSSVLNTGTRSAEGVSEWQPSHFSFNVHSDSELQPSLINMTRRTGREYFRSAYHCSVNMSAPELRLLQDALQHAVEHVYTTKRAGM